ncbi:MAG: carboxypeptidase regulatory-like domain-containing protein, partial [Sedimentisphaerales bacterium]|nr:carboxypeptidase regulatory-like domain-containing protein [Sedimentisphaerales bacterium]
RSDGTIVGWGTDYYGQATPPAGNEFTAIAAGWLHSLALRSDGTIVGWGVNWATPLAGNEFIAIAAGGYHGLALRSDGTIAGWGDDDYGQATGPSGSDFITLSAGMGHSLALSSDGTIVGWGNDEYGQATPPAGNNFTAIAAGCYHSLALRSDGTIVGWGSNEQFMGEDWFWCGQATPPAGNEFTAIAAGDYHSLALRSDGTIAGWGDDYYGQATPPSGNDFMAIAAGAEYSLALRSDGTIVGWGADWGHQVTTPPAGNDFSAIAAGCWHGLALRSDGAIVGWGFDGSGQATPPAGNSFTAIAAGKYHSLALRSDGTIAGWGFDGSGQATPPAGNNFIAIAAGYSHSLALRSDLFSQLTVEVTASASFNPAGSQLSISAIAYDRATGDYMTSGSGSYYINGMGKSGQLTYSGGLWRAVVDLSTSPPAPGQYTVTVTIGTGSATCKFIVAGSVGEITGTVQDVNGIPLGEIAVGLYESVAYLSPTASAVDNSVTEPDGSYHFSNVLPGFYMVDVYQPGYMRQSQDCEAIAGETVEVNIVLSSTPTLGQLSGNMSSLHKDIQDAMGYETGLMDVISYQAFSDLSASIDAWDAASFIGGLLGGVSGSLNTVANQAAKYQFENALSDILLWPTLNAIVAADIDRIIQRSAQSLLPDSDNMNSWRAWDFDALRELDIWVTADSILSNANDNFTLMAPQIPIADDFDFYKADQLIALQRSQIWQLRKGDAISLLALPDPSNGFMGVSIPMGYQLWKMDHAAISYFGEQKKVWTTVQVTSGGIAVGTAASGIGAPAAAPAGTIYTFASAAKEVSAMAETGLKFHGGLTYAFNAVGWARDMAALGLPYTETKELLEQEASNPHYLSSSHSFSSEADLNLNTLPGNILIPPPLLPGTFNVANVHLTNTSDATAVLRVVPTGWWDYYLPDGWRYTQDMFGGVRQIKVYTTSGAAASVELAPGASETVSIPYLGFYLDPINMFSPHWLAVDVYAGPFLVKSLSQPYYVLKVTPMMCPIGQRQPSSMGMTASFEKDGQVQTMSEQDYAEMVPIVTTLSSTVVDANTPVIEEQFTVDANSLSVCFKLISNKQAHIALQVYDANENCVGYDTARGGIQNEFIATYIGNGSGNQDVDIPVAAGKAYTIKAVLEGAAAAGPFDVQLLAFETPIRPAVLAVMPSAIDISTQPINTVQLILTIGEAGRQQPLHGVNASLSDLTDPNGLATLPVIGPVLYDVNDVPAASSQSISFEVSVPKEVPVGDYAGEIVVTSSNAGSITIPVTIINDDIPEDLTRNGIIDFGDFVDIAAQWLEPGQVPGNLNRDEQVDFLDLSLLADKWLWQASWYRE